MDHKSKLLGGILLVSGTTIGAGMLALPVGTGLAGFYPSLILFIAYWIFMTFTALLMLEVNLWMGEHTNLISMAKNTLGRGGQAVSWLTYCFLLYALTTAYLAGCAPIVVDCVQGITGYVLPEWAGPLPLLAIFGYFVYKGTKSVDYVNRWLMFCLVAAYAALVVCLTPNVEAKLLDHVAWKDLLIGVSLVATSFGFHIIIPSLTQYMNRDIPALVKSILIGSFIPLVVYSLWEFLTLGIIPLEGKNGLIEGYREGANGAHLLSEVLGHSTISLIARFFSFFAIVTSFLGVSLSCFDFLADGFRIKKTRSGRGLLFLMTFAPPLVITWIDPRAFLSALEYAGAFGVVTLLGLLPALMVWMGRYHKHYKSEFKAPGGKAALLLVMAAALAVIGIEVANKAGLISFY